MGSNNPATGYGPIKSAEVDTTNVDPEMQQTLAEMRGPAGSIGKLPAAFGGGADHPKNQGKGWHFDWTSIFARPKPSRPSTQK